LEKKRLNFNDLDLDKISQIIDRQNREINKGLIGIQGINKIAESLSRQFKQYDNLNYSLNQSIESSFKNPDFIANLNSLNGLSQQISIQFNNKDVIESIAKFTLGSQKIINDFNKLTRSLNFDNLNQLSIVDIAIRGLSKALLKDIATDDSWSDLEVINSVNQELEILEPENLDSYQSISDFRNIIVSRLEDIILKAKSPIVRAYFFNILNLASFMLSAYSFLYANQNQITIDKQSVELIDAKFENFKLEIENKFNEKLANLNRKRVAKTNVNLRYSNKKKSRKLGLVKKGQTVNIIEIRHKWLLVMYIDFETGAPKSGFVYKKYFEEL